MKLLAKYSRINLAVTIIIFLVSSVAYYLLLSFILVHQIDDDLKIEEEEINTYVSKYDRLPENIAVNDQVITYSLEATAVNGRKFSNKIIIERDEEEDYRQLVFGVKAAGEYYSVTVAKSLEDTDALIRSILLITFLTILSILIASFVINRWVLKKIWEPFYFTLDKAKSFRLGEKATFYTGQNLVEEFSLMDKTFEKLINQAEVDYLSLKTFSENASHEIQTPLAVIRSKLDLLVQDEDLTEKQSELLQSSYAAVEKLTRLNHSLLLLTKIENNQFWDKQEIDLKQKIEEKLTDFQELWQSHGISVQKRLETRLISVNSELLEIMLNNLLSNAMKYNYDGGHIYIQLTKDQLQVSNTSHQAQLEQGSVFQRFYKSSGNQNQNGLGLSIIKQIVDDAGFGASYSYKNHLHCFTISWQ